MSKTEDAGAANNAVDSNSATHGPSTTDNHPRSVQFAALSPRTSNVHANGTSTAAEHSSATKDTKDFKGDTKKAPAKKLDIVGIVR